MDASEERAKLDARTAGMVTLIAVALLAMHVVMYKTGPDEFFPVVTRWRTADPMSALLPTLAMLAMTLGSLALTAMSSSLTGAAKWACGLAFPFAIAIMAVLPNAPIWFASSTLLASGIVALALPFV